MKVYITLFFLFAVNVLPAQIIITSVYPGETDAGINTFSGGKYMHVVYFDQTVLKRNQLFLFLPGTNGTGMGAAELNKTAARCGYHVISLMYPDSITLSRLRNNNNPKAYSNGREEVISGEDLSLLIDVDRTNSIENRLIKLLQYLTIKFPDQNWQQFLENNKNIAWEKIAVAGLSQGGGHAGYIAKKHLVARVLMFGSPKDFSFRFNSPADWVTWESKTPLNNYFTFVHSLDEVACSFEQQIEVWKGLGMYKNWQLVNVDSLILPYNHSHLLTSIKPQRVPHTSVCSDITYLDVWKYMLTEPEK